jgi:Rps23 Pro-64 3,4-dihydroxylase Tpa1-like proline 4-hydroxylase
MTATRPPAVRPFFLDPAYLDDLLERHRARYRAAQPVPHAVLDDFLPAEVAEAVLAEFPDPGSIDWRGYATGREKKLESASELTMGPHTRLLLYQLNSSVFLKFLEGLTGIQGLIPDPHCTGGGLHQIERGGFLKIHADFNREPYLKLDRRLNLLVYLNKDWREEYGGHFELWDRDMEHCVERILPVFNRCVIFSTTDYSYHGHPEPLTCPEGWTRKSFAMYYYSNGRPAEDVSAAHSTLFRERPGEHFAPTRPGWQAVLKKVVPPILVDLKNALRR